jgi:hypothetical protein
MKNRYVKGVLMIDSIFKIGLLALGVIFLVLLFQYASNGRYEYNIDAEDGILTVFDTRHGTFHLHPFPIEKDNSGTWKTMSAAKKTTSGAPID